MSPLAAGVYAELQLYRYAIMYISPVSGARQLLVFSANRAVILVNFDGSVCTCPLFDMGCEMKISCWTV